MKKIMAFGENLIRYDFDSENKIRIFPTGTPLNILSNISAIGLVRPILHSCRTSKKDYLIFSKFLNEKNIEDRSFESESEPMGSYQLYRTNNLFGWEVVYNRSSTAWSHNKSKFNEDILEDIDAFHFDGISLYSSKNSRVYTFQAIRSAKNKDIFISFDFNFRKTMNIDLDTQKDYFREAIRSSNILNISYYDLLKFYNVKSLDNITKIKELKNIIIVGTKKLTLGNKLGISAFSLINGKLEETQIREFVPKEMIGQGDSFIGHILSNYLEKKQIDLDKSLDWSIFKTQYIGDSSVQSKIEYELYINKKHIKR